MFSEFVYDLLKCDLPDSEMNDDPQKVFSPPYTAYSTLQGFLSSLRENGGVPSRIDKSLLSKKSGSAQAAILSALKSLKLIDEEGVPTQALNNLIDASDQETYLRELRKVLESTYPFLTDGSIDLTKATTAQLEQKFRDFQIRGSTVVKAMAFFITVAKEVGIQLSPYIKVPKMAPTASTKQAKKKLPTNTGSSEREQGLESPKSLINGFVEIVIPIHGMPDGKVLLPEGLGSSQWAHVIKMTQFILENYRIEELPKKEREGSK